MPAYNNEQTIANAINSIFNQTFKEWELLIIDDGSTDNTWGVVQKYQELDKKRIFGFKNHQNLGISFSRNFGCALAHSPYLVTQDADDLSMPDRLEKVYPLIQKYDVVCHAMYVNEWDYEHNCIARAYRRAEEANIKKLLTAQYLPGVAILRKEVWQKKPYREETKYSHDYMAHLDWLLSGFKYYTLDIALYEYVRHSTSSSIRFEREGKRAESFKRIKEIVKKEYALNFRGDARLQSASNR